MASSKKNPLLILIIASVLIFISVFIWKQLQVDNSEEITPIVTSVQTMNTKFRNTTKHNKQDNQENGQEVAEQPRSEPFVPTKEDIKTMHKSYNFQVYLSRLQTPEKLVQALLKFENSGETDKANMVIDKLLLLYPDYELPNN